MLNIPHTNHAQALFLRIDRPLKGRFSVLRPYVQLLRFFVLAFALNQAAGALSPPPVPRLALILIAALYFVLIAALLLAEAFKAKIPQHVHVSVHRISLLLEPLILSGFYLLTGDPESDIFLFFFLPYLTALSYGDAGTIKKTWLLTTFCLFAVSAVMLYLPYGSSAAPARPSLTAVFVRASLLFIAALTAKRILQLSQDLDLARQTYRNFLDGLPCCVFIKDPRGRFLYGNPHFLADLPRRFTLQQLTSNGGLTDKRIYNRHLAKLYREADLRVMRSNSTAPLVFDEKHQGPNNEEVIVRAFKSRLLGPDKSILGVIGIYFDITAEQRRLQASERRLRQLFDEAPFGIYQSTPQGKFNYVNNALTKMLGFKSPEALLDATAFNMAAELYANPEDRLRFTEAMARGRVEQFAFQAVKLGSPAREIIKLVQNARSIPGPDGKPHYFEGFVQDITDLQRMKREGWLKDENDRLFFLKSQFYHDVGKSFARIGRALEQVPRGNSPDSDRLLQTTVDSVHSEMHALGAFAAQLTPDRARTCKFDSLTNKLKRCFDTEFIENRITSTFLPTTRATRALNRLLLIDIPIAEPILLQALKNLIDNSIESLLQRRQAGNDCPPAFVKVGFRITSGAKNRSKQGDKELLILVADNGVGVPEEHRPQVFDFDFTTKKSYEQHPSRRGVGLAAVKDRLETFGARVSVTKRARSRGALFVIQVPLPK